MRLKENLIYIVLTLLLTTCSEEKTDQQLLDEDRQTLQEALKRDKVLMYKLIKLTVRDHFTQKSEIPATNTLLKAVNYSLDQINDGSSEVDISWTEWLQAYQEYNSLKSYVIQEDEDQYPTVLENLVAFYTHQAYVPKEDQANPLFPGYTTDIEHSILSFVALPTKQLGKEIALYEASQTNTENLTDGSWKAGFLTQRGIIYSLEGLYYLSEAEITQSISWLEAHPNAAFPFIRVIYNNQPLPDRDTWLGLHAANHLYRGIDRMLMERQVDNDRAIGDFEVFLSDCNQLGWNDELIWIVQTYVGLKQKDHASAIAALERLRTSSLFSSSEQEAIDEAIAYLRENDEDGALKDVYDQVFMAKLITKYILHKLSEVDWDRVLRDNNVPEAEKIIAFNEFIKKQGDTLDDLTSIDDLKEKGKEWYEKAKEVVQ